MSLAEQGITSQEGIDTSSPHRWKYTMAAVEGAIKANKEGVLFLWQSKDLFGRKIEAKLENIYDVPNPVIRVTFDSDEGFGLGYQPHKLILLREPPEKKRDKEMSSDGKNEGLYVGQVSHY